MTSPSYSQLQRAAMGALEAIRSAQLPSGELPSIADHPPGQPGGPGPVQVSNPFVSTFVCDSLTGLGPRLHDWPPSGPKMIDEITCRVRDFLRDQEEPDGTWRFLGKGSAIDPDSDCSACAAVSLLCDGRSALHVRALGRFLTSSALYSSYVDRRGFQYSWIREGGEVVVGHDRVVNANVARFLALAGEGSYTLWTYLENEVAFGGLSEGSPDYPNPMTFLYTVARAAGAAGHALPATVKMRMRFEVDQVLRASNSARQRPLTTAMAILAGIQAGQEIATIDMAARLLFEAQDSDGLWPFEPLFVGGYGSRTLNAALALEALASVARLAGASS